MYNYLEATCVNDSAAVVSGADTRSHLGLVEQITWRIWVMWTLEVSIESGKYLVALVVVRPCQLE